MADDSVVRSILIEYDVPSLYLDSKIAPSALNEDFFSEINKIVFEEVRKLVDQRLEALANEQPNVLSPD